MSRDIRLIQMIDDALRELEVEIAKDNSGETALDSGRNLEFMRGRLLEMKRCIGSGLKEGERYRGSMAHMITDTWIENTELGKKISEIEYIYYRYI